MATQVGQAYIDVDANTAQADKNLKGTSKELDGLTGAFKSATAGSAIFTAGMVAIGYGLTSFAKDSFMAFAASEEVTTRLGVAVKNAGYDIDTAVNSLQKQATALQANTRFTDEQILSANSMMVTNGLSLKSIEKLTPALLNTAEGIRGVNGETVDLNQLSKLFAKSLGNDQESIDGMGNALAKAGVRLGETDIKLITTGTEAERVANLTRVLDGRFKDMAFTAGTTLNGQMDILTNQFDDFKEQVGKAVATAVRPFLQSLLDMYKNIGGAEGMMKILTERVQQLMPYMPIIIGFIIGGMVPAFVALGAAIWGAMAPLLPFLAAGVAVGAIVMLLIDAFGGWNNTMLILKDAWNQIVIVFNTFIKPALDILWQTIQTQLLPELQRLWEMISPVLLPVLKMLALILGGTVLIAIMAVIGGLILFVKWLGVFVGFLTDSINTAVGLFNWFKTESTTAVTTLIDSVVALFNSLPDFVKEAIKDLADIIMKPFQDAWGKIEPILNKIKDGIRFATSLTVAHSPSVVDEVTRGIDLLITQYSRLGNMSIPSVAYEPTQGSNTTNQDVNIYIDKVGGMQDVQMLGREFGFRMGVQPK
jgi:hypothetical protein